VIYFNSLLGKSVIAILGEYDALARLSQQAGSGEYDPVIPNGVVQHRWWVVSAIAGVELFERVKKESCSMEEVADVMDTSPRWYQLCWSKDRNIAASMLRRAEAAGYSACCYTRYPDDGMARVRSCKYVSSILVWRRTR
jgi:hypothetical protein